MLRYSTVSAYSPPLPAHKQLAAASPPPQPPHSLTAAKEKRVSNSQPQTPLLHLTNNLTRLRQRLHHLQTLLPSADRIVALLEQLIDLVGAVHVLEEFALHLVTGVLHEGVHDGFGDHVDHGAADDVVVGCDQELCTTAELVHVAEAKEGGEKLTDDLDLVGLFL
jgi:hypothetical protein